MAGRNGGPPPGSGGASNASELVRVIKGKIYLTSICSLGGGFIASAYSNFEIDIWNANTGERVKTLTGHTGFVSSLCSLSWPGQFSLFLASGSYDNTVRVWNVITGECVYTMRDHTSGVTSVCMHSPYDEYDPAYPGILVSGSADKTVRVWNVKGDWCVMTLRGHTSNVTSVCSLSSLGEQSAYIASGSSDKTIRIWSLGSRETLHVLEGFAGSIVSICSLGGGLIACGCFDAPPYGRTLTIWNTNLGECKNTLTGHDEYVTSVCSLGHNLLASGCADGKLRIWNIGSGECINTLDSRERRVNSVCSLGPERSKIVSIGNYDTIRIWDIYKTSAKLMEQVYRQRTDIPSEIMNHIAGFAGAPLPPNYFSGSEKGGVVRPGYVDPLTPEARKAILNGPAKADAGNPLSALPSMNELNRKRKSRRTNRRKGTRRQRK